MFVYLVEFCWEIDILNVCFCLWLYLLVYINRIYVGVVDLLVDYGRRFFWFGRSMGWRS